MIQEHTIFVNKVQPKPTIGGMAPDWGASLRKAATLQRTILPGELTVGRGHIGPRPRLPLRAATKESRRGEPAPTEAESSGAWQGFGDRQKGSGSDPGGRSIPGFRSPERHLELRNLEGFRSQARVLQRRPGTSELRRLPELAALPGVNRA